MSQRPEVLPQVERRGHSRRHPARVHSRALLPGDEGVDTNSFQELSSFLARRVNADPTWRRTRAGRRRPPNYRCWEASAHDD